MSIEFVIHSLGTAPFYHGYGEDCLNPKLTFAKWNLPLIDCEGTSFSLPFFLVDGDDPILLGNDVLAKSNIIGDENLLVIPAGCNGISETTLILPTYKHGDETSLRTHLHVVPSISSHFRTFFTSINAFRSNHRKKTDDSDARYAKNFAYRLHAYTHLTPRDMKDICRKAKMLTPVLSQALSQAFEKCSSCKQTGRPLHSRKVSFNRLLASFNDRVQVDFLFIQEMGNLPILHAVDIATGFSVTVLMFSRSIDDVCRMFTARWIDCHGPPSIISCDPEFNTDSFRNMCVEHDIHFQPRPARRHNKIGSVEVANASIRLFVQRLLKDENHYRSTRNIARSDFQILSRATFLKNIMLGSKRLSSFELAKGYTPSISGIPSTTISKTDIMAFHEQLARRAVHALFNSNPPVPPPQHLFSTGKEVYFFLKQTKGGKWVKGYVVNAQQHILLVSMNKNLSGKHLQVAYEDVRLAPSSNLLKELDNIELGYTDTDLSDQVAVATPTTPSTPSQADDASVVGDLITATEHGLLPQEREHMRREWPDPLQEANTLLAFAPLQMALVSSHVDIQAPSIDLGNSTVLDHKRDIGNTIQKAPIEHSTLTSMEQQLLRDMSEVVGFTPITESKLQFAPRWILDKAIAQEKQNYVEKQAFIPISIRNIPRRSNLISSRHFFQIKRDGQEDKLKLKCRLVPHGNRDAEKENLRSDSATAQFACIRCLLSLATIMHFGLGTIDVSSAYLQAERLNRDIFMRPPRGWTSYIDEVWKLTKPAYGLVESGRLWQLCIEDWLLAYGFTTIPGMPQLFVLRDANAHVVLLLAKVVDDLLLAGTKQERLSFHSKIKARFQIGRFITDPKFIFNRLHITQHADHSIHISMQEFMDTIAPIDISRDRRKQHDHACTKEEVKQLQSLAGKLNFLGHGVLPQAALAASKMQQNVANLHVSHLKEANASLAALKSLDASLLFNSPETPSALHELSHVTLLSFSDASTFPSTYWERHIRTVRFGDWFILHIFR